MRRVREKGPRRRCSTDRTLVRTIPIAELKVPPIPTSGSIGRPYIATPIADYAGISTTAWTSGSTGILIGDDNTNRPAWNSLYHHWVVNNPSVESYSVIMHPLRYTADCPNANGGQYDHLILSRTNPSSNLSYQSEVLANGNGQGQFGLLAIDEQLLPGSNHGEFKDETAYIRLGFGLSIPRRRRSSTTQWQESGLQAIAASVLPNTIGQFASIHAIHHRINGGPVGTLIENPGLATSDPRMRLQIDPGDVYSCDVWWRLGSSAALNYGTQPRKSCYYLPTSQSVTGSRSWLNSGLNSGPGGIEFTNVDWTPNFNRLQQTYRVTVTGHSGWTVQGGSNGPHVMVRNSRGFGGPGAFGGALLLPNNNAEPFWRGILLAASCECPFAVIYTGPAHSVPNARLLYQPASVGNYRTSVFVAHQGQNFNICSSGPFNQAGTTTFNLVPWSVRSTPRQTPWTETELSSGSGLFGNAVGDQFPVAHRGFSFSALDVPTSMTFTRVNL